MITNAFGYKPAPNPDYAIAWYNSMTIAAEGDDATQVNRCALIVIDLH